MRRRSWRRSVSGRSDRWGGGGGVSELGQENFEKVFGGGWPGMDDPNMTMEEYIKLEEEKAYRRGQDALQCKSQDLVKEISTNIGGEFKYLDILKCWRLKTSRKIGYFQIIRADSSSRRCCGSLYPKMWWEPLPKDVVDASWQMEGTKEWCGGQGWWSGGQDVGVGPNCVAWGKRVIMGRVHGCFWTANIGWVVHADAIVKSCDAAVSWVVTASRVNCDAVSRHSRLEVTRPYVTSPSSSIPIRYSGPSSRHSFEVVAPPLVEFHLFLKEESDILWKVTLLFHDLRVMMPVSNLIVALAVVRNGVPKMKGLFSFSLISKITKSTGIHVQLPLLTHPSVFPKG
ncbi:hypothetical protein Tco_0115934 [Tanacetum coccineum]